MLSPPRAVRVVIVDDDDLVLESVADVLRDDYPVLTFASPQAALDRIREVAEPIDILITDLKMAEMNGLELVRQARTVLPSLLAIVITGYGSTESAIEALRSGAFDFVQKPIRPPLLRSAVERAAKTRRHATDNARLEAEVVSVHRAKAEALEAAFTDLTAAHDELQRTHTRLIHVEKLASVGQLASGVAHEINNPAAFIHANLVSSRSHIEDIQRWAAIARESGPAAADEALGKASLESRLADLDDISVDNIEGIDRVVRIVNDLLGFARNEPDSIELVDLNAVVENGLKLVGTQLRHSAALSLDLGELPLIEGDGSRLVQVVTNLLVNAAQAVGDSDAPQSISVRTEARGRSIFLSVADSGCGIDDVEIDRIFDAFYTTKPRGVGTGLGLSLSASIIRVHGGSIEVKSELGVGTTIVVQLPQALGERQIDNVTPIRVRRRTRPGPKPRVLMIDDEEALLRSMKRVLGGTYQLTCAAGGVEALELLERTSDFDVIFCDVMMPEVDGPMLYHRAVALDPSLAERFVFCTGGAFTGRAREFLASVSAPCAQKPLRLESIHLHVAEILQRGVRETG